MSIGEETTTLTRDEEVLILEASRLHYVPDWERLMEASITPALFVGGERRLRRASRTATTHQAAPDPRSTSHAMP